MTRIVMDALDCSDPGFTLLELMPDTQAWIKDLRGQFVFGNQLFYRRFGFRDLHGLLGKRDEDIAPAHLARRYTEDDAHVLSGGAITDRLELIPGETRSRDWFLTSKWPVYNRDGAIIGSFGISRHLNRSEGKANVFRELDAPMEYINEHYDTRISIESLARASHLSVSALERRFRRHLKKTPHEYLTEVRLDNARRLLLETGKRIGDIAIETGFSDHSHFTRAFSRRFGMSPRQARAIEKSG